jgi:hypothetical protein
VVSLQGRATADQIAAVNNQFWYLGYRRADRAERLAACAALLELNELASTKDLTAAQAGQLVRVLAQLRSRGELRAVIGADAGKPLLARAAGEPVEVDPGTLAVVLAFALCVGAWRRPPRP